MTIESGGMGYPGGGSLSVTKDPGDPFTSLLPPSLTEQVMLVTL